MQVTGSFKPRGALAALSALRERSSGPVRVVAASAGNHGAGVSHAARVLGIRATLVVPTSCPRTKRDRIVASGAEVLLGPTADYDDAEALAMNLAAQEGASFVSAYDDLDVVAGNGGSLAFEIVRALGRVPDAVVVPLGGGGLASGLACGFAASCGEDCCAARSRRRVWGVQSEASAAMAESVERGVAIERMASNDSVADGLAGGILARAFDRAAAVVGGVVVVSERAILEAMAHAYRELGIVLEGSAACGLVPALAGLPEPMCGGDVVLVLTGRNVDREVLARALGA
jgi:threonine dehydratase